MARETYAQSAPRGQTGTHRLSAPVERMLVGLVAVLLLIPCFWQPHIAAGDLSSHLYNAWLAGLIERGNAAQHGLSLAHPITNVLADWATEKLLYSVGPSTAERIVVSAAVEIFFWGAFFFITAAAGQPCWIITPSLAMISYGLVFHIGFLNFYLSTGFSLWLLALLWRPPYPWLWIAIPIAALALLAHPLPLAWAVGALLYTHGLRCVPERQRGMVWIAGVCLNILVQTTLLWLFPTRWFLQDLVSLDGILGLAGAGQLWLYGPDYLLVVAGILIVWFLLFLERLDRGSIMADPVVHIWGLSMLAYILLPRLIQFPQYQAPLEFMQLRVSLFIAILFCAMVAGGMHGRSLTRASCVLSAVFFTMLYLDDKSLNRTEAQVAGMLSTLPPGQRVITALQDTASMRLNGLVHIGSAACIERCWDFGNYEPPSAQFRVRVSGLSDVVVGSSRAVSEIESGRHVVTAAEAPLYNFCRSKREDIPFELRRLAAGETTCLVQVPVTNRFIASIYAALTGAK